MPKEWVEEYTGGFDQGWEGCAKKRSSVESSWVSCRQGPRLAPKPAAIKDWDTLTADQKKLFIRQMEVFAGSGEYTDTEIGRRLDAIGG